MNYKDGENQNLGVEFENLVLDDGNQLSYGTHNMQYVLACMIFLSADELTEVL